jgi:hypothetical protein
VIVLALASAGWKLMMMKFVVSHASERMKILRNGFTSLKIIDLRE